MADMLNSAPLGASNIDAPINPGIESNRDTVTATGSAIELEDFIGDITARLVRVRNLASLATRTYGDHLSRVDLRDEPARQTADNLDTLIDVMGSEAIAALALLDSSFSALVEIADQAPTIDDPVSRYWKAFDAYNAGRLTTPEYGVKLEDLHAWVPPTPLDFVRKFEAMFAENGNPNELRKAILTEQAIALLGGNRTGREG